MYIGEDSFIDWSWTPQWSRIHFVENDGMAFGIEIWGPYGKILLSLFRIVAVGFLIYFIRQLLKSKASMGLLICFSLILAGAIGNILDSAFYGLIFSASSYHTTDVAQLFPEGGGYSSFLHGKVVDMLYFPMYDGFYPEWFPYWGGDRFEFFKPVFNIADVSISTGVISILVFQRSFFSADQIGEPDESNEVVEAINSNESENLLNEKDNQTETLNGDNNPLS